MISARVAEDYLGTRLFALLAESYGASALDTLHADIPLKPIIPRFQGNPVHGSSIQIPPHWAIKDYQKAPLSVAVDDLS